MVNSVASSLGAPDVVAFGGSDKALRIWDSRSRKEGLAVQVRGRRTTGGRYSGADDRKVLDGGGA